MLSLLLRLPCVTETAPRGKAASAALFFRVRAKLSSILQHFDVHLIFVEWYN
jgi:hypothetical protein